jgi:hypothetical protein
MALDPGLFSEPTDQTEWIELTGRTVIAFLPLFAEFFELFEHC